MAKKTAPPKFKKRFLKKVQQTNQDKVILPESFAQETGNQPEKENTDQKSPSSYSKEPLTLDRLSEEEKPTKDGQPLVQKEQTNLMENLDQIPDKQRLLEEFRSKEFAQTKFREKPTPKQSTDSVFFRTISTKHFILSQFLILVVSLTFLAGLYYVLNKDFPKPNLSSYLPVTQNPVSFNLEVSNPDDNLLVFDGSIVISGTTSPTSTILVTNNDSNQGLEANTKGDFYQVITLNPGVNRLTITAIDNQGNQKTEKRTIYYTQDKL